MLRTFWPLLLSALVACAPAPTLATPDEEAAIDRALLADFWDGRLPHSACVHDLLGREGQAFYVWNMCGHWVRGAQGKWEMSSGGSGPAVVILEPKRQVHQLLTPEFIPRFFPPQLRARAFTLSGDRQKAAELQRRSLGQAQRTPSSS